MNENELLNRLDQHFVFIMDFSKCYRFTLAKFTNENINIFKIWLHKLCVEPYDTIAKKRLRNAYASKLLTCLSMGQLTLPFTEIPQLGYLEPISVNKTVDAEPLWLKDFVSVENANDTANDNTYMASKVLDNEKGACAYVAVSMNDRNRLK